MRLSDSSTARRTPAAAAVLALTASLLIGQGPAAAEPGTTPEVRHVARPAAIGPGSLTPTMRQEIDRVVALGAALGATGRTTPYARARVAARCATFEGQRYCLGIGWTTRSPSQVARSLVRPEATGRERTGDLAASAALTRTARMRPSVRARADRRELTAAARSVAKVWLLRHEIQGVPLPAGFAARHPEVSARGASGATAADYPERTSILRGRDARAQNRSYWCGPATMQAIGWGWKDRREDQAMWARRLGTSSAGTSITDMVRVVNGSTGYDRETHAGPYIVLDIADFSFDEWYLLMMRHIADYEAPVVMHPVLLKRWYAYLDDDASGHFQVGRGFDQNPGGNPRVGYFEPWDQSKFDPTEPFIDRVQWRSAYKAYRANRAHFQHNVGV